MQINSYAGYDRPAYLTSTKGKSSTSFEELMKKTSLKTASDSTGNIKTAQVSCSPTWLAYANWSENREPVNVPSTDGWKEENIQYLKDRYHGELSVFERIEALHTMVDMGCITPEEYQKAIGTDKEMVVCDAREAACISGRLEEGGYSPYSLLQTLPRIDWTEALKDLTIGKANTLDELFDLLGAGSKSKVSGK